MLSKLSDVTYWENALERAVKKGVIKEQRLNDLCLDYILNLRSKTVEAISKGTFEWSIPKKVEITKIGSSKKRLVYVHSDEDQLILNVLYQIFSEQYASKISNNVFSYKRRVDTNDAVKSLISTVDIGKKYAIKVDISSYFNSIDSLFLKEQLEILLKEEPIILDLLTKLHFRNKVIYKGNCINEYMALIPGSPLSSFFANYLLKDIDDTFVQLGKGYARYSDDIIIFADNLEEIKSNLELLSKLLEPKGLTFNQKKCETFKPKDAITFLGIKIEPTADGKAKRRLSLDT